MSRALWPNAGGYTNGVVSLFFLLKEKKLRQVSTTEGNRSFQEDVS